MGEGVARGQGGRQPRVSRLRTMGGGSRSFGHENSAPLVAQNHPPSIDLFRSRFSAVEVGGRRKEGGKKGKNI